MDDRLPSSKTDRSLHMTDRNNPTFLWPALVEKAYLKVRGGYDFPGSNSGTDLCVLTGWIPEQLILHDVDVTGDYLWERLFKAFHYGDVLLTVGTGSLSKSEEDGFGLVSEHDYAILDMKESGGRRLILVKNPWAGAVPRNGDNINGMGPKPVNGDEDAYPPGRSWVDCESILQNFENIYLNWNPELFSYRQDIHFTWDLSSQRGAASCFVRNPQVSVSTEVGGTVWLLLGKHFRSTMHVATDSASRTTGDNAEFISIYVFKADGKRVCLSDGALHRGPYVDSPNTLAKLEMPPKTTYTVVISEQSLPPLNQSFTLSALSTTSPVKVEHAKNKYPFVTKVNGSWTSSTAGGNAESARYSLNPQFSVETSELADAAILLETSDAELAVHVKLIWSNGKRVSRVRRNRDIITDSGDYRRGGAFAETKGLDKGIYTAVCSTFTPDQLGQFTLWIFMTRPCETKQLPPEIAGRHIIKSNIGILPPGNDRMAARLHVPRMTRVKFIAKSLLSTVNVGGRAVTSSPMLLSIELGQNLYRKTLANSEDGDFVDDAASGIRTDDLDLRPGMDRGAGIWIVVERIGGGPGGQVEDHIVVEALAEERVEIGEWILADV